MEGGQKESLWVVYHKSIEMGEESIRSIYDNESDARGLSIELSSKEERALVVEVKGKDVFIGSAEKQGLMHRDSELRTLSIVAIDKEIKFYERLTYLRYLRKQDEDFASGKDSRIPAEALRDRGGEEHV